MTGNGDPVVGGSEGSAAEKKAESGQALSLGAKRIITQSACEPYRDFIEQQTGLGRNAQAIYQDLVDGYGYSCKYNSVKRFVKKLKTVDPKRFDILEFAPGEEAQVDYGQGALTVYSNGKVKRPYPHGARNADIDTAFECYGALIVDIRRRPRPWDKSKA